ncbi:MAG: hypothetical protein ABI972_05835 [Acidobacteriota bacterium]
MRNFHIALLVGIAVSMHPLNAANLERIPLTRAQFYYEQNVGQLATGEKFSVRGAHYQARLTDNALRLHPGLDNTGYTEVRFASGAPAVQSAEAWPGVLNRYEGSLGKSFMKIPAHRRLRYENVVPNIDLTFAESGRMPSLEWNVHSGGDAATAGLTAPNTTANLNGGVWLVRAGLLDWQFGQPVAWQEQGTARTSVDAGWSETAAGQVRLQLGTFDASRDVHVSVSIKGLVRSEIAAVQNSFTIGPQGTVYSATVQESPRTCTLSPSQINFCPDAVIAAYQANGEPLFVTVLAGKWQNEATAIALSGGSDIIVGGYTASPDFPVTADAHQMNFAGPEGADRRFPQNKGDAFLARLDRTTGELKYATYLGGANGDRIRLLAAAPGGEVTVVATSDDRFPVSPDAWVNRARCSNCPQTVLARFDASMNRLLWSTFLPFDPNFLKVASDGSPVIAGIAGDANLATAGALQTNYAGNLDAILVKFAPGGGAPVFSTYWGGTANDYPAAIDLESNGDVWLALTTNSPELLPPGTDPERNYAFLERISADGARVVTSRFLRSGSFGLIELSHGSDGKQLLSGSAGELPVTKGALMPVSCGGPYIARYAADGALEFATYVPERTNTFPNYLPTPDGNFVALYSQSLQRLLPAEPAPTQAGCIVSAAGFGNAGIVSPGQIVTIFGSLLGPEVGAVAAPAGPGFPSALAGVQVKVNGTPATILYAQSTQINAIVPFGLPKSGTAVIEISYSGKSTTLQAFAEPARVTFFTVDGSTNGYAAAFNQDGSLNSPANPARRGEIVVLFGTGMGVTSPPSIDGAVAIVDSPDKLARPTELLVPFVNDGPAQVLYLGQAPGLVNGVVQMNVRIPATLGGEADRASIGVPRGNTVRVAIR